MDLRIHFFLLLTGFASVWAVPYCPVSHSYNSSLLFASFYGYPVQLFYPNEDVPKPVYNCNVVNTVDPNPSPIQLCDFHHASLCPVRKENIRSALSVAPWPQYVDVFNRLGRSENVNVFYLGGSMTQGTEAVDKCICMDSTDMRCPRAETFKKILHFGVCGWPAHLSRWLSHEYPSTKFHIHDYPRGGSTSQSAHFFIDRVRGSKSNLSHPALFFLDFSVNDAQSHEFIGQETYMRTIIGHFGQHFNVKPTIVVLETFPHANYKSVAVGRDSESDYALVYRRISKHYGAVLISLREVFWTYFGEPDGRNLSNLNLAQRYYPISPFDPYVHAYGHPPWYVHLFVADVLAECMKRIVAQLSMYSANKASVVNTIHNLPMLYKDTTTPDVSYTPISFALPDTLYDISAEMACICNLSVPYVVDAVPKPPEHTKEEDMSQGWVETPSHNAPGWLIDNRAPADKHVLSFPIRGGATHLHAYILKINYLLSYEGMGTAHLTLCGQPFAKPIILEGLWKIKASIPRLNTFVLKEADIANCRSLSADRHTVDVVYVPGADQGEKRAKHNHQFKVFDLRLCAPATI